METELIPIWLKHVRFLLHNPNNNNNDNNIDNDHSNMAFLSKEKDFPKQEDLYGKKTLFPPVTLT